MLILFGLLAAVTAIGVEWLNERRHPDRPYSDPRVDLQAEPVSYDGETAEAKAQRRRRSWTPARVTSD